MNVKRGVRARGVSETHQGCARRNGLSCVSVKDNQPSLMTQTTIAEMLKLVIGFCALRRGDAVDAAISLASLEA